MSALSATARRRITLTILTLAVAVLHGLPGHLGQARYSCAGRMMTARQIAEWRGIDPAAMPALASLRSLDPAAVCTIPEAKLARALGKIAHPRPDHPGEAVAFRELSLRDEWGLVPADGLSKARVQIDRMRAVALASPPKAAGVDISPDAGIERTSWSWLGPGNIGGRIRSILIHPTQPSTMFVGSVSGGIWRTDNGGAAWAPVDDFMANLAVATMIFQPGNPSVIYAGTGEGFYNTDGIRGAGVFKSADGGASWSQLASTTGSSFRYVNRLAASSNGAVIVAATRAGIYRSSDGGGTFASTGVATNVLDVDFHPADPARAVASGADGNAWYSNNGGVGWAAATGLPAGSWRRVEVAFAPSSPSIVYASVDDRPDGVNAGRIYRSTDGGATYSLMTVTPVSYLGGQGWYDNALWVDPTDADTLIVGGIDLWRSTNGGQTLTRISQWQYSPASAHADHHVIVSHPQFDGSSNKAVYFGNDGGIYRADNVYTVSGLSGWTELNNNLGITQFYGGAGNATSGVMVGGTQDNGTLRYNPSAASPTEQWTEMFGGDGGWSAADPGDPNYFYGEYVYLQLHRSTNGGASSSFIDAGLADAGTAANFIAPFVLDPNNPNTMLAGGASLWRSTNVKAGTPSWSSVKASVGSYISAIAIAPGAADVVWVGHNNGDVYVSTNATAGSPTWTRVDTTSPSLPNRQVTRVSIDAVDTGIVYVTFGGFSADNIWKTTNGGATWTDATGSGATGLPDVPVRDLEVHPQAHAWLYAATEVGIFTSEDGGATWFLPHDGPSNVSVDELFFMGGRIVAVTHGRGFYQATPLVPGLVPLTVTRSGAGTGRVVSVPAGLDCGATCDAGFTAGTQVALAATPDAGSVFAGWSGDCSGTGACTVTMSAARAVTATFSALPALTFPDAVDNATLTFTSGGNAAWLPRYSTGAHAGGDAASSGDIGDLGSSWLEATVTGPGTLRFWWKVSSEANYDFLRLYVDGIEEPTRISGSTDWQEATTSLVAGLHTVRWQYEKDESVAAGTDEGWVDAVSYEPSGTYLLTVAAGGGGSGVVSSQAGLTPPVLCSIVGGVANGACAQAYGTGSTVTLTAVAAPGSVFTGWAGNCSGTGACTLPMWQAQTVTAGFFPVATLALNVSGAGSGAGTVASTPGPAPAIACDVAAGVASGVCSAEYAVDSVVTLSAVPLVGSTFSGWGGACAGTGPCTVTMSGAKGVVAAFDAGATHALAVSGAGEGSGSVVSQPGLVPSIACLVTNGVAGASCTAQYAPGTLVTLSASAAPGSSFEGWSGACSGTAPCSVTMQQAVSLSARFGRPRFTLAVSARGAGAGDVASAAGTSPVIACAIDGGVASGSCAEDYDSGTAVTLTATPRSGGEFTGWSGACAGTGACTVTMTQARDVVAGFGSRITRYLAEGATSAFFTTRLGLANVSFQDAANAELRFQRRDGVEVPVTISIPPGQTRKVTANLIPGLASAEFATVVESDLPLAVHRYMTWDASGYGSHSEAAVGEPAATWYFAEGSTTSGFQLFYLLQNPGALPADVEITFLLPSGAPVVKTYTVPARSRVNVWVNTIPELASTDVSAIVRSTGDVPIIAERAMYLDAQGLVFAAGHESAGVTAPSTSWFLAEGATGPYFDTFVLLANPGTEPAHVVAQFMLPSGQSVHKTYDVPGQSRYTVWVDLEDPATADTPFSTRVTSDVPILVERAMWWPGSFATWQESHNSFGATETGTLWGLGEGMVGGTPTNTDTYVLLANASDYAGRVAVSILFDDGVPAVTREFSVGPTSRLNIHVRSEFPSAVGKSFGVLVESLPVDPRPAAQIVVEEAIYSDALGRQYTAGANSLAMRLR